MKTLRYASAVLAVLLLCTVPVAAQTQATTTTLSAAASNVTGTTISVTSATGFTVNNYLWVDGEAMRIRTISGTTIGVLRGQLGTFAHAHANADIVITGAINHFKNFDPDYKGTCTVSGSAVPGLDASYLPWINVLNGNVWKCSAASAWSATNLMNITFNSLTQTR